MHAKSERSAARRKDGCFREQLAKQSAALRAEYDAKPEFAAAPDRAREQQVRRVHARR